MRALIPRTTADAMRAPSSVANHGGRADWGEAPSRVRISPGPGVETAESTLAAAVFVDRGPEDLMVEVGPEVREEDELGIGRLPRQEIRHPLLAGGADDEIGIRNAVRVEGLLEGLGIDPRRVEAFVAHPLGENPNGAQDLLSPAIVERDDEGQ